MIRASPPTREVTGVCPPCCGKSASPLHADEAARWRAAGSGRCVRVIPPRPGAWSWAGPWSPGFCATVVTPNSMCIACSCTRGGEDVEVRAARHCRARRRAGRKKLARTGRNRCETPSTGAECVPPPGRTPPVPPARPVSHSIDRNGRKRERTTSPTPPSLPAPDPGGRDRARRRGHPHPMAAQPVHRGPTAAAGRLRGRGAAAFGRAATTSAPGFTAGRRRPRSLPSDRATRPRRRPGTGRAGGSGGQGPDWHRCR